MLAPDLGLGRRIASSAALYTADPTCHACQVKQLTILKSFLILPVLTGQIMKKKFALKLSNAVGTRDSEILPFKTVSTNLKLS